jgi:alpha-glucosidase
VLEEGAVSRRLYLPNHPGGWHDFRTGEAFPGGEEITVEAPLGHLPVFVRAGAMVPVSGQLDRVDPASDAERSLLVFGEGEGEAVLYEDDGDTMAWRESGLRLHVSRREEGGETVLGLRTEGSHRPAFTEVKLQRVGPGTPIRASGGEGSLHL